MRIIETKVYTFNELSDEAKQHAIESLYDLNVDHEWWENVYEDAENVGLKIEGFDIGRGQDCTGHFIGSAWDTANEILKGHGPDCETFKTATDYMAEYKRLEVEQCQDEADRLCLPVEYDLYLTRAEYLYYQDEIDTEDIDAEFLRSLLEDYRIMLQKEYEYLTSEEAIIECIDANEYEFTAEGNLI